MDSFLLLFNALTLAAQGILQLLFIVRVTEKRLKLWEAAVFTVLLFGTGSVCAVLEADYADIGLNILFLYFLGRFGLKNNRQSSCVTAVLAVCIAQLSFGLINSLSMLLFPMFIGSTALLYILSVSAGLFSLALCFICYRIISSRFSLKDSPGGLLLWLMLPAGLFLFIVQFYIHSVYYTSVAAEAGRPEMGKHLLLLILQTLGMGVLFSSLLAYRHTIAGIKAQADLALLEQETHAQKNYVLQAQMRYENTRAFRHDIKNYLSVLDGYLKNGEAGRARDYLKKLDAAAGELSFPVNTGSPTVDILLGDKLALARMDGTALDVSLTLPQPCAVTDLDWCVIFGNALDNAIRACAQTAASKRISISGERQGDFYMLEFENTCSAEQPLVFRYGIGLGNIKGVAEKYGGAVNAERRSGLFRLNVLLNISVHEESISVQRA